MRAVHKIHRQGNSLCVSLPRPMMHFLHWMLGSHLHIETDDQGRMILEEVEHRHRRLAGQRLASGRFDTAVGQ